jgi:hypothetical protein
MGFNVAHDYYSQQKINSCTWHLGFSLIQKCTSSMRMFIYNVDVDGCDEYCKLWKSTTSEVLKKFCQVVLWVGIPSTTKQGEHWKTTTNQSWLWLFQDVR